MTSMRNDSVLDADEVAQLSAAQMERYGMTASTASAREEPRHLSETSSSSDSRNGSTTLATQLEEERQVKTTLATQLVNANRTIQLLNMVVDAKDQRIAELATERGQDRKALARSSSQLAELTAELADVQSELTIVSSKDSRGSKDSI